MPFGWRKKTTNTLFVDCEDGNEDEKILKEEFDSGLGGFGTLDGIHGDPRKPKLTAEYGNHPTEIQRIGVAHANPSENFHASNRDEKGEGNDDDDAEEELDFGDVDDEGSDNNFDDEQSYSTAGFGGPLFNEDDYSVQDSVAMSVDSFDPATQLEQWRSRQAADFLSDFRAKRKSSKDNKKSKRNDAHRDDPESAFATNLDAVDEDDDGSSDGDGSTNHAASQDDTHADIQSNHATLRCSEKDVVEVLDPFAVGDEPFSSEFGTQQNLLFPSGASGTFDTFADDAKPPKDVVDDMEPSAVDDQPFSLELDSHQEVLFPSHVSGTFDSFDEKNSEEVVDDMAHISEHDEPFSSRTTKTVLSPNDATNIVNTFDDDSKTPFVAYNVAETAVETHIISDNLTVKFSPFAMVEKKEAEILEHFANNDDESRSVNLLTEFDHSKDIAGSELLSVHRPKDVFPTAALEAPRHTDLLKELDGQAMTLLESRREHNIAIASEQPDIPVSQNENVDENSGIDEGEDRSSVQDIPSLDCVRTDDPSSEVNVQTDMIDTVSIIEEEPAIVQVLAKASINPNEGNEESDSCKAIETIPIEVGIQWSGTVADVSEHGSDHERNHPEFAEFVGDRKQECSENHPSTEVCTSDLDEISFFPTTAVDPVTASREGEVGQEGNDDFPSIFSAHDSGDDAWGCAHVNPSPHAFGKSAEGTGCAVESVSESHVEPSSDRDALALPTMDTRDDSSSKSNNKCPGSDTLPEGEKGDVSDLAFSSQFEGSHQDCLPTQEQGEMTDVIDHQEPTPCGWKQFGGAFTDESGFSAFAKEFAEPAVNRQGSDSSDGNDSTNQEFLVAKKPCSPLKAHLNRLKKAGFDELFGDYDPSVCGMSEAGFSLFTTNTNRSADTEWLVRELINAGDAKSTSDASGYDASKEFTTMIHVIEEGEAAADGDAGDAHAQNRSNGFSSSIDRFGKISNPSSDLRSDIFRDLSDNFDPDLAIEASEFPFETWFPPTIADVSEHGSDHERNHPEFAEFVGDCKQECSENHPSTEVCTSDLDEISFFPTTAVDPVTASREGEVGQEGNDDFPSIFSAHDSGDDAWGCAHVNPSPHAFGKSAEGTGCAVESVSESHVEPTSDRDALALPTMDTRDDSSSKSNNKCPGSDTLPEGEKGDVSDLAFSSQFEGSHQDCLPTQEQGEMTDVIDHQEPTPCGWKQFGGAFTDESGFSAFAKEFAEPAVNRQGSDSSDGNDSTNQEFLVAKKPCSPLKAHLNRLKKAGFDELFGDYDPSVCGMSEAGFSLFTTNTNRSADTEWLVRELINAGDAKSTSDASGYDASKEFTTMIHVIEEGEAAADDWAGCVKEGDADSNWNAFPTPVESTVDVSSPMNETLRVANCCSRESSGSSTAVDRDGERDSIMKSFCTLEEPVCSSLDDERIQSDSNSDYSESDESIGDVDVPFTGKLVIKEAPLLRLENVTQQTRSRIPEDKGIRRKKNKWKWFGKAKAPRSMQQLDQMPSNSDAFADGTPDSSNNKSFPNLNQSTKESGSEGQIFIEHQGTSLATIPIVPTKKARKSKKKDLSSHLGIPAVRKIGRHGDEVSVGTTSKRPSDAQQVVLPRIPMPDNSDNLSVSKERRPWGDKLFPTNQENVGQTSMSPRLGIFGSIVEEAPVPDVLQNQNHALSAFPDDALSYGIPTSRRFDSDGVMQDDAISELQVLSELERNEEPVNDDVNFDDMWDEVSCDVSTALEFQRQKHNRMKKKESDDRTPNDIESCAVPTNRLRLFDADDGEFQDHDDKRCDKLSDEFVSAIRGVFDDNSDCEESCDSNGGGEESSVRSEKPTIRRQSSVTSLFVNGADEPGVQAKVADSSDSDSSTSVGGTDSGSDSEKEAAARTRRKRQKDTVSIAGSRLSRASTRTSRRSSSIKAKPDPKKVLEDEILKARDSKVLSVSSLREEMHSRRGTSANLLRKEYEACKRNSYTDDGRGDINDSAFDTLQLRTKQKDDFFESTTAKLCLDTEPADRRESDNVGSSNGALANSTGSHRARWGRDEQSTELDDLMTVQEAPRQPAFHGVLLKAQDFAATVQANIPTMPHVPGLATIPHLPGFGSMSSLSKSPQKISVSSPIILASPNTTMELPTLSDFGTSRASYTLPFDDGPSTAVAESDEEDDDQKLVSGKGCDHYNDDDEEYSVTPRKQKGIGMKLSAVKIQGISKKVKNLVPKVHGNKRSNGTVLTTADDMHGLLE